MNVGVGAWKAEGPHLREHLARTCAAHGLRPEELEHVRGHRLPMRPPGTTIVAERSLLVGDAAGLIDPVSGDGMYECFVSGSLAAAAIGDLLAGRSTTLTSLRLRSRCSARLTAPRFVAAEAGSRPVAAAELADCAHRASLALDRAAAAR